MREGKWRSKVRLQFPVSKTWEPENRRWGITSSINDELLSRNLYPYFKEIPWDAHEITYQALRGGLGDDFGIQCICSTRKLIEPWHLSIEGCAGIETTADMREGMAHAGG